MGKIYTIDGDSFNNLEGFYEEVSANLIPGKHWGHNLDAFNDILRGGFGTPEEGFVLVWKNARKSKVDIGQTTFMTLVDIILEHDGIELRLVP